jgi:hypothetical protein
VQSGPKIVGIMPQNLSFVMRRNGLVRLGDTEILRAVVGEKLLEQSAARAA